MLVVSLCKPVIHKFKILGGGNLNIINQWEELQKGGGPNFDILVGEAKKKGGGRGGERNFWLKFNVGILEEITKLTKLHFERY